VIDLESGDIEGKIISSSSADNSTPGSEPAATEAAPSPDTPPQATQPETTGTISTSAPGDSVADAPEVVNTIVAEDNEETALPPIPPSNSPPAAFSVNMAEKTEFGFLPKIRSDGTKPWRYYAKPFTAKSNKPMVAVIITDLGSNRQISEQALRLPEEITLSFSPYARDLNSWALSARLSGHETLIDLPMEPSNYPASDPGPLGLLVSKDQGENETKIKKLMAHDFGYVGFLTPRDENFLANNELFKSLQQILSSRGLMLVIGKQPSKNETREMIEKGNTASVIADTIIDEELTPTAIQGRLSLLQQTAKQRGYAVGIAQGYPITIKQVGEWAAKAEENGFMLVPVSLIVSKHY
jgi:polysaccharide deacetylase 2 family uncharacterized protein YibQ